MSAPWLPSPGRGPYKATSNSPSVRAFRARTSNMPQRFSGYRDLDLDKRSTLLDFAGASTGSIRAESTRPEYERRQAAAEVIEGVEPDPQPTGVQSFLNFVDRPRSAIVGLMSGLQGIDRVEGVRPGQEASLREGRSTLQLARERAMEGLRGEEDWRVSDFGRIAEKKAEGTASTLERGWAATTGFIVDTVLDPLTYLSFGGTILGRRLGQEAVLGYTQKAMRDGLTVANKENFIRSAVEQEIIRTPTLAQRFSSLVENRIDELKNLGKSDPEAAKLARQIEARSNRTAFNQTDDVDELVRKSKFFNWDSPGGQKYSLLEDASQALAPEFMALQFYTRGAGGLRRWSVKHFGEDIGNAYFASLPRDIQGGIRWRVPFYRDEKGVAKAFGIPGIGAARLSEKSPFVRNVWMMTEKGRDKARKWFGAIPMKYMGGEHGEILWRAGLAATGQKMRTSGGVTYVDYSDLQKITRTTKIDERRMSLFMAEDHVEASSLYTQGIDSYGDKYLDVFQNVFYDEGKLKALGERVNAGKASDAETLAHTTASQWRRMLNDIGGEIAEEFQNVDDAVDFLVNYVPRVATEQEMRRRATRAGIKALGSLPQYTKHRSAFGQSWKITKEGDAVIVKFLPPEQLNRMYGTFYGVDEIYRVDPREFMGIYLAEVRASLVDQKTYNRIVRSGILANIDPSRLPRSMKVQPHIVASRAVEAVGEVDESGNLVEPGWLQGLIQKLEVEYGPSRGKKLSVDEAMSMGDYLQANSGNRWTLSPPTRTAYSEYVPVDTQTGVWRNEFDGSYIFRNADDSYSFRNRSGEVLRDESGNIKYVYAPASYRGMGEDAYRTKGFQMALEWMEKGAFDPSQASSKSPRGRSYHYLRNQAYRNAATDYRQNIINESNDFLSKHPSISLGLMSTDELAKIPPDQIGDHMQSIIRQLQSRLEFFGAEIGDATVTKSGRAVIRRSPTLMEEAELPTRFKDFLEKADYFDVNLKRVDGSSLASRRLQDVKGRILKQMELDYAPEAVMRAVRRMFESQGKPSTAASMLWEEVYKPFYAMQKSLMTLGRGPGFVARNIIGGSWNNLLNGVGRQDNEASARLLFLRRKAKSNVESRLGSEFMENQPQSAGSAVREEFEKLVRSAYSKTDGNYLSGVNDADALIELDSLFFFQGLSGDRNMARVSGEIAQRARDLARGNRNTAIQVVGPDKTMIPATVVSTARGTEIITAQDVSKWERSMNYLAFDNPWIRNVMSPMAESSEDYLRFAAFLKGAREVGLEPAETGLRGYSASLWVKATQFDYSDLNDFERNALKMIVPFYTWTRNNVPLQIRALIHEPGKIQQAIRIQESLAYAFGDDNAGPSPSYVLERFGFEIPEESFAWLPESIRPQGNVAFGLTHAEPVVDISRWIRTPSSRYGERLPINLREVSQNLNPLIATLGQFAAGLEGDPSIRLSDTEPIPGWASLPGRIPGVPDFGVADPETGERVISRYFTEIVRTMLPMVGMAERYVPWVFGGERQPGRWFTTAISAVVGLPVSTIDDWKRASEQQRESRRIKQQMDLMFGTPSAEHRMHLIRTLVDDGAPTEFIDQLDIGNIPDTAVDTGKAMAVWQVIRRMNTLVSMGVPIEEAAVAFSAVIPEGTPADEWVQAIWNNIEVPDSDLNRFMRAFDRKKLTKEDLAEFGLKQDDLRKLSNAQLRILIAIKNDEIPF